MRLGENPLDRDNQQITALHFGVQSDILMEPHTLGLDMLSIAEVAWLAGFLDADGMIRLRMGQKNKVGPKSLVPIVTYTNTCRMTGKRICELIGKSFNDFLVHTAEATNKTTGGKWSTKITIEIGGVIRVYPFLAMLQPYLITKSVEADLMLRFCALRTERRRQPYGPEEYQINEALKYLKKTRHLRDYMPSAESILSEDIVRSAAEAVEVAEMSTRLSAEARKEWARNLVSTYRWNKVRS